MNRRRIALYSLAGLGLILLILILVAIINIIVAIRGPFPKTNGRTTIPGLQESVDIYRDEWGVAHIYAQNEADMFFAQGYVHAQDRWWQMEWSRHIGQGRLSELAGESTLETDKFIRNLGWNRAAEASLALLEAEEPEVMAMLEAYSAGVNAYLDDNEGNLALDYDILGLVSEPIEVEPWQPLDTVSWTLVMAWNLRGSGEMFTEQDRMILEQELGTAMTESLLPLYPDDRPVIAPTNDLYRPDSERR